MGIAPLRYLRSLIGRRPVPSPEAASPPSEAPSAQHFTYPWFKVVEEDDIEQGDLFEQCPVFLPPSNLVLNDAKSPAPKFAWKELDLVVMTQSCDLVKDRPRVEDVLLCAVWRRSELPRANQKDEWMEDARKGKMPGFNLLAASTVSGFDREVRVVDFRRIYSLPLAFLREKAKSTRRLRLLPPYREHLSQSFARMFMRIGLPVDIPPFTPKK